MIKSTLTIALLIGTYLTSLSQSAGFSNSLTSYANWSIANQDVVWQNAFSSSTKNKEALKNSLFVFLKKNDNIQHIEERNFKITADLVKLKVDYKKFGGSARYTSPLFLNGLWTGKIAIQILDNAYVTKVDQLSFDVERKGLNAGEGINGLNDGRGQWNSLLLNKDKMSFKEGRRLDMDLLNKVLIDIFDLKK
jgi:hypothetical protein